MGHQRTRQDSSKGPRLCSRKRFWVEARQVLHWTQFCYVPMSHIYWQRPWVDQSKVNALTKFPWPKDVDELTWWLGIVTYVGKFCILICPRKYHHCTYSRVRRLALGRTPRGCSSRLEKKDLSNAPFMFRRLKLKTKLRGLSYHPDTKKGLTTHSGLCCIMNKSQAMFCIFNWLEVLLHNCPTSSIYLSVHVSVFFM